MGGIEAGKAYLKFLLEDSALKKGLRDVGGKLSKFGKIGAAATAPIIAGFTACANAFITAGAKLDDLSKRTGIGGGALSQLAYAAEQSGTNIETLAAGVSRMQKNITAAGEGTGTFGKTLQSLGVDLGYLQSLTPEEQFTLLADSISKIQNPTERAAMAQRVFGGSARELLPLLAAGADRMRKMRDESVELGAAMTDTGVAAAGKLDDALVSLKKSLGGLATAIGEAIFGDEGFATFIDEVTKGVGKITEWVKQNEDLVQTIAKVTLAVGALAIAAIALGAVMTFITLHPIVLFLTLIAGAVLYVTFAFDNWHDRILAILKMLGPLGMGLARVVELAESLGLDLGQSAPGDKPAGGGSIDELRQRFANAFGTGGLQEEAAKIQAQVTASVPAASAVTMDQGAIAELDKTLGADLARTATFTERSAVALEFIVQQMRRGGAGFAVGTG